MAEKTKVDKLTPEMVEAVRELLAQEKERTNSRGISMMTDIRDPKKIETVRVKRLDGKFVIGFKDYNTDPYESVPKYTTQKVHIERKLPNEPHITLILSDGKETTEKELPLIDYMNNRKEMTVEVIEVKKKEIIEDFGFLGARQGAVEIDSEGKPVTRSNIKKETKRVEMSFIVQLPDFDGPIEIKSDFLA